MELKPRTKRPWSTCTVLASVWYEHCVLGRVEEKEKTAISGEGSLAVVS